MPRLTDFSSLNSLAEELTIARQSWPMRVTLSAGTCGQASGSMAVLQELKSQIKKAGLENNAYLRVTGCQGFCQQEPLISLEPLNVLYCAVRPEDVKEIVQHSLLDNKVVKRLLYCDSEFQAACLNEEEIPFFTKQDRVLMSDNRFIDPCEIGDYLARGGYSAFATVLTSWTPQRVISEIKNSRLRGRGGGGYSTGKKWEQCRSAPSVDRYVICNADEGDPGAYMDRSILEGNPHSVLEGMLIGAFAIGAEHGFFYVRREYPLAVTHIRTAIEQAYDHGLLGDHILGTDFSFDVRVVRGGGAFVCGESTALMASLEGKVGEPRAKDVHTVEQGYLEKPTNLNNVETWANIPKIILNGAAWFAAKGTENSKGTKVFTLTGQVKNTGLVEVNMGVTLREIIYDIGGGPKNGCQLKAVQTGGPSGGLIPASQFDLPVDFDVLYNAGSMVGSGGMIVLDENSCMIDIAKYFLTFLQDESCGKCSICRLGVSRLLEMITAITEDRGSLEQLDLMEELAWTISQGALCALGKTASNPVLSTLRYFRDEYETHIKEHRCPAGVCKSLIRYAIDREECTQCGECAAACPHEAVIDMGGEYKIDDTICQCCAVCEEVCTAEAISRS